MTLRAWALRKGKRCTDVQVSSPHPEPPPSSSAGGFMDLTLLRMSFVWRKRFHRKDVNLLLRRRKLNPLRIARLSQLNLLGHQELESGTQIRNYQTELAVVPPHVSLSSNS